MVSVFLSGMTVAMFLIASVFFLKFWKSSSNRFFGLFAFAFGMFALEPALLLGFGLVADPPTNQAIEASGWLLLPRLAGFMGILIAIADRNRN